ncbi:domain KxDL [Penicillium chermesinum]|uniref:Biogenesis of lysosome-related organelles complex 1 subunit KXD1 n=1 Tax=Penicillium chermesinum TaxID=63820 RepID=A0A9W9PB71_9EURO|nr:domain KxDL [Penicillium chermesinum]KAJ5239712.1 domain KxDL [Penicillium chermesinum]
MASQRHYYQPSALPMGMPSKAPAPANMYPISRVPGSPTDYSDASTTAGSRTSGGLTFSSAGPSADYESSSASYSGVDVMDVVSNRMQNAFDPTPLDRNLVTQAQTGELQAVSRNPRRRAATGKARVCSREAEIELIKLTRAPRRSGELHAKQQELMELQAMAQRRMKGLRSNFNEGLKTARETKRDLEWTQKRVSALKSKAEKAHPDEYRRAAKNYTYGDY